MVNYSKRMGIIVSIIITLILWISVNVIFIQFKKSQKKEVNSTFVLKTSQIFKANNNKLKKKIEGVVGNQYKQNGWRILISKINLDAPILEGTEQEVLRRGVGHFTSTSKWDGNVVLAAHNRGYKYNFFQEIKRLELGDKIEYKKEQATRTYEVIWKGRIKETDLSCLENTKENKLTLITCEENMPEYRVCIQAREIKRKEKI